MINLVIEITKQFLFPFVYNKYNKKKSVFWNSHKSFLFIATHNSSIDSFISEKEEEEEKEEETKSLRSFFLRRSKEHDKFSSFILSSATLFLSHREGRKMKKLFLMGEQHRKEFFSSNNSHDPVLIPVQFNPNFPRDSAREKLG